jgi:hypothetical protein
MSVPVIFSICRQHTSYIFFFSSMCREFCASIHYICLQAFDISMKINFPVQKELIRHLQISQDMHALE